MDDDRTTIQELKDEIKEFCDERDWGKYHSAKELSIGMITESAELIDHFRFKSDNEADEILADEKKRKEVNEELSDVLYFVLRFAQKYKIDLAHELREKMKKNSQKYPLDKAKGSNKKYNEL
ncbi:nucleotide pyrophosphohydrolase [Candidatus Marsarchaeota archaeon]|jgi:NTP pyrophosphatase (non-canonical NTP hydrolase)|nr:nucleotide pyrophosphohydrolase [Candidatus Marsarchaeota archaeon]MCL5089614.1 nucleotide pyrophosphohydrolase [Candidatus Marsarchaeota archaeon]